MLALLFVTASQTQGLPPGLLSALCFVESSHRVSAINIDDRGSPSLGVCQIKYETAKMLGYKGDAKGLQNDPTRNVHYASKYLAKQVKRYGGDYRKAVAAFNAGKYNEAPDGQPMNRKYVGKVFKAWSEAK